MSRILHTRLTENPDNIVRPFVALDTRDIVNALKMLKMEEMSAKTVPINPDIPSASDIPTKPELPNASGLPGKPELPANQELPTIKKIARE